MAPAEMQALCRALQRLVAAAPAPAARRRPARKRRARAAAGRTTGSMQDGVITLSRSELVQVVRVEANAATAAGHVDVVPASFAFLKGIGKSFERVRWDSMQFYYKPAVAMTFGGLISMGMDWDFATTDVTREKISSFTPNLTCACWKDTEAQPLVLPAARLQSRPWYLPNGDKVDWIDAGPGKLHWAVDTVAPKTATTVGEIWVRYRVTMQGTNPA